MRVLALIFGLLACASAQAGDDDRLTPSLYATVHFGGATQGIAAPRLGARMDYTGRSRALDLQAPAIVQWDVGTADSAVSVAGLKLATVDFAAQDDSHADRVASGIAKGVVITAGGVILAGAAATWLLGQAFEATFSSGGSDSGTTSDGGTSSAPSATCSGVDVGGSCVGGP